MSLVAGEDSESDEEINTDQLHQAAARHSEKTKKGALPRAGIVAGEDSEEEGKISDYTEALLSAELYRFGVGAVCR